MQWQSLKALLLTVRLANLVFAQQQNINQQQQATGNYQQQQQSAQGMFQQGMGNAQQQILEYGQQQTLGNDQTQLENSQQQAQTNYQQQQSANHPNDDKIASVQIADIITNNTGKTKNEANSNTDISVVHKIYRHLMRPMQYIMSLTKVNTVMRNIATCVVNGAVELITYYFPAPLIPIIASAAGMMIPFEPIRMLRDRVPVTSYRRAIASALNSFLGTFDRYKLEDNYEYDPYMTQRFNRRMMNFGKDDKPMIRPEDRRMLDYGNNYRHETPNLQLMTNPALINKYL